MANEFIARNGVISKGNVVVTGSLTTSGSLTTTGTITATTLVVQTITSSISSITGSTNFGSLSSNTHQFTGSVLVSGSGNFSGSLTASSTFTLDGTKKIFLRSNQGSGGGLISGSAIGATGNFSIYSDDGVAGDILGMYYWNGSTYRSALQFANVSSGNSNLILIKDGGNVGIGTSSPFAIADINTSINGNGSSALQLGVAGTRTAQFFATSGEVRLSAVANVPMLFYTNDTERMRISSAGYVTTPNQPFASMGLTTDFSSVGGTIIWQQVHYNVGNCYNSSTGIFTCPVAGKYLVSIMCMTAGIDATLDIGILFNGGVSNVLVPYQSGTGGYYNQVSGMTMLTLQANDTLAFKLNSGTVYGSSGGRHSSVVFALMG